MKVAIFLCSNRTMGECFEKQLFGTSEPYGREVRRGDLLFLYNYEDNTLYGMWRAETNGGTYDKLAWGRRYPNQVKVTLVSKVMMSVPRYALSWILGTGQERMGQILSGHKAQNLLQYFAHDYSSERELGIALSNEDEDFRNRNPANFTTEDGHRVRSKDEKIIDDWLYRHKVPHAYEPIIQLPGHLIPDFAVHQLSGDTVYIGYWGMAGQKLYDNRRLYKSKLYAKYRLPLIELEPHHLHSIDVYLPQKLKQKKVPYR